MTEPIDAHDCRECKAVESRQVGLGTGMVGRGRLGEVSPGMARSGSSKHAYPVSSQERRIVMAVYGFWFGVRRFESTEPSLTVGEIIKMADASPHNMCFQDKFGDGPDIAIGHGVRVDLTREPHFYCVPAATMYRGGDRD